MNLTRTLTATTALVAATLLIAGCTTEAGPTPTPTQSSAAPVETRGPVAPPESEDEAIEAADAVLTEWFEVRGEVNAAGGTDTAPLEDLSTGNALDVGLKTAAEVSTGPLLNVDMQNIEGPIQTEGAFTHEMIGAYGQEWEGVENGLVTINACLDGSDYKLFASDGSEGMRPENLRNVFDFQVIYDADRQAWLVYDLITLDETC